jgi:uncharacterized membrane protein (UPF0127 family)
MGIIAETWSVDDRVQLIVRPARGLRKLTGLLGMPAPAPGVALAFEHCRSVHGIGMTYPIDVVFVDGAGAVTSVRMLRPMRVVSDRRAVTTLELRTGEVTRLRIAPGTILKRISAEGG